MVTGASALDLLEVRGETGVVEQIEGPVTEPARSEAEVPRLVLTVSCVVWAHQRLARPALGATRELNSL